MDSRDSVPPTPESFRRRDRDEGHRHELERRDRDEGHRHELERRDRNEGHRHELEQKSRDHGKDDKHVTDDNYEMSMNQVFGHSQYRPAYRGPPPDSRNEQQRPQAPQTDRYGAHPLQMDRDRRPEAYEHESHGSHSPKFIRAGHYRGGRPDLGFYQEDAVEPPYPQEPLHRRTNNFYEQPPEIGFNPYKEEDRRVRPGSEKSSATRTSSSSKRIGEIEPNPGWYLMMRFHKDGEAQVRHALFMCHKHIEADGGRVLGIARPTGILIHEGGDAWVTFGRMRNYGDHLEIQQNPKEERTNYCVLVIYYPSLARAIQWFDRDGFFKQKDFPAPYATDCIVLPVHGSADTRFLKTISLTEYPKITYPEYFRDYFSIPTEDLMKQKFRAMPYVVKTTSVPVDDDKQRVARHLRGSWIKRNSVITISLFESLREAVRYYTDPEYLKFKDSQDKVSHPTTIIMDLEDWRPPHAT